MTRIPVLRGGLWRLTWIVIRLLLVVAIGQRGLSFYYQGF